MVNLAGVLNIEINWLSAVSILIIFGALFISVRGVFKRHSNTNPLRRNILLIVNFFCLIGLSGLILRPAIINSNQAEQSKVRLVTSLTQSTIADVDHPTYTLSLSEANNKTQLINTPQQLLIYHPELTEIEIIGDGLTEKEWQGFEQVKLIYTKPQLRLGLVEVNWNKSINLGESLLFSGRLQNDIKKTYTIQLIDPAGDKVAETLVRSDEFFSLSSTPKIAGLHQYRIEVFNDKEELVLTESIHLQVKQQADLKLLVLQSSPSFEIKQLQNWAAENGAKMLVKTKISQNKYTTRLTNLKDTNKAEISTELFESFDMLIIDGRGLIELSTLELTWLKSAVENGLGLLFLIDQELVEKHNISPFELLRGIEFKSLENQNEVAVYWRNNNAVLQSLSDNFIQSTAVSIEIDPNQLVNNKRLVESANNKLLVHQNSFGLGQVAVSLLKTTHQWVTAGHQAAHSQYWKNLISQIAKPKQMDFIYPIKNDQLYFEQRLAQHCVTSSKNVKSLNAKHLQAKTMAHSVLLQSDPLVNNLLCGYFWPEQSGWYQLANQLDKDLTSEQSIWFYVESKQNWLAMQQQQKIAATLAKLSGNDRLQPNKSIESFQRINLWYFWWLFFISASLIWFEKKLSL